MRGRTGRGPVWVVVGLLPGACFVDAPTESVGETSTAAGTTSTSGESTAMASSMTASTTSTTSTTSTSDASSSTSTGVATDEGTTGATSGCVAVDYFYDGDGDSYGDDEMVVNACDAPPKYAPVGGDCDDGDLAIHPGADELCDTIDNDCDKVIDEWSPMNTLCDDCDMMSAGGSVYHRCKLKTTWAAGRTLCQGRGGDLVIVSTLAEHQLLTAWAPTTEMDSWIGMTDVVTEGVFLWVDGSALTLNVWAAGEPNNSGGNEDCGELRAVGQWNDAACVNNQAVLCESPAM